MLDKRSLVHTKGEIFFELVNYVLKVVKLLQLTQIQSDILVEFESFVCKNAGVFGQLGDQSHQKSE